MLMFYLAMIDDDSDRLLFEKIYYKYSEDIFRRVYGILKNREDAEDAVQDTWQRICDRIEFFREKPEKTVRGYIMSVAKNRAFDILRRRRKEESVLCDIEENEIADDTPLFSACGRLAENEIVECIKMIGETYSDVLVYHYLYNHTLKEIAVIMGLNESTVGSRLTRGKEKLVELLKRRGY